VSFAPRSRAAAIARRFKVRDVTAELLDDYDPVPSLVARGVMSDDHDQDSCEANCCRDEEASDE